MYVNLQLSVLLEGKGNLGGFVSVFIAMPIILTSRGNTSFPTGQLITGVRID